jgi:hypothetical protein
MDSERRVTRARHREKSHTSNTLREESHEQYTKRRVTRAIQMVSPEPMHLGHAMKPLHKVTLPMHTRPGQKAADQPHYFHQSSFKQFQAVKYQAASSVA